jgi:hypothetical protein
MSTVIGSGIRTPASLEVFVRPALVLFAALAMASATAGIAEASPAPAGHAQATRVCSTAPAGYAACNAWIRTDIAATLEAKPATAPSGLSPANLLSAYNLGSLYPSANGGWAQEISLDVDMASAICPQCNVLLVEASSATMANLGTSVNTAVKLGADVVSNSYGGSEYSGETTDENTYFNHPGVAITVSSGDAGYGVEFPAASRYVTAVGGTSLRQASNSRGWTETAWNGAGSGCSAYVPKPSWQTDTACSRRTVADVSAVADPATGVAVYDSTSYQGRSGWLVFGGTSVSSPIVASVYALTGTTSVNGANLPYAGTSSLNDVTSGSNGSCGGTYLCTAVAGYDGPTGLGTPNGAGAF